MVRRPSEKQSLIEVARNSLEAHSALHDSESVAAFCLRKGIEMEQVDEFDFACEFYAKGIALDPRSEDVRYFLNNNIGYSLNQLRRFDEAEPYCRTAIAIEARRHNAHKNLGVSLTGQKRYAEAAVHFVQATKACPADGRALLCLERLVVEVPEIMVLVPGIQNDLDECRTLRDVQSSPSMN